ncbi:CHAD domain-containing protein [bacterium]|nr:MAG: CHAD domain-containing protein [bacterium]
MTCERASAASGRCSDWRKVSGRSDCGRARRSSVFDSARCATSTWQEHRSKRAFIGANCSRTKPSPRSSLSIEQLALEVVTKSHIQDETGRHELRKALKRLRYVLEMFENALPNTSGEIAESARQAQDALGDERDRLALAERTERQAKTMDENAPDLLAFVRRLQVAAPSNPAIRRAVELANGLSLRTLS